MKKVFCFHIVIISLLVASVASAKGPKRRGGSDAGGGNIVVCKPSPQNSYSGTYSLDYLLMVGRADEIYPITTAQSSLQQIQNELAKKIPALATSLADFISYYRNEQDPSQKRVWQRSNWPLIPIPYADPGVTLGANCQNVVQAVIRTHNGAVINYKFHSDVLHQLEKNPTQLSFLLIHEWLWDHTDDEEVIWKVNKYLHSKMFYDHNETQVQKSLKNLNLTYYSRDFATATEVKKSAENYRMMKSEVAKQTEICRVAGARLSRNESVEESTSALYAAIYAMDVIIDTGDPSAQEDMLSQAIDTASFSAIAAEAKSVRRYCSSRFDVSSKHSNDLLNVAISMAKNRRDQWSNSIAKAAQDAAHRTDIQIYCKDRSAKEFIDKLAQQSRGFADLIPKTAGSDVQIAEARARGENAAKAYENLCEDSVQKALKDGMTTDEIIETLKAR